MSSLTLLQPPRIVFGEGCAVNCVELLAQRGVRRALLVTSASVRPQIDFLLEALSGAHLQVIESRPVQSEPTRAMFEAVLQEAKAAKIEAVIGIGGGSAMDVAKLVAALARGGQSVAEVFGLNLLSRRELFLLCLPTTSGTGSEVSPNAILLDETDGSKKAVISPHLVPDAAFIDPLLTLGVPPSVTATTGLDALTHCIEAFANKAAHPIVDLYALQGIRLLAANLLRAVRDGRDVEARSQLALGSLYGGLCLGPVNTAAVHALAYPLGGQFHVPHGISNAVLLPQVLRFNLPHAPERYAEVAVALGVERNGSALTTAAHGLEQLVRLSESCGVPQRLSQLGVARDAIPSMAKAAMQVTRLLKNNPRPVTEADAVRIYEATF